MRWPFGKRKTKPTGQQKEKEGARDLKDIARGRRHRQRAKHRRALLQGAVAGRNQQPIQDAAHRVEVELRCLLALLRHSPQSFFPATRTLFWLYINTLYTWSFNVRVCVGRTCLVIFLSHHTL